MRSILSNSQRFASWLSVSSCVDIHSDLHSLAMLCMHFFFQQMQWSSLTPILVLPLALEQCTWMKFSALAERLTSLTALRALVSAVLLSTHMQEYDVKVWSNGYIIWMGPFIYSLERIFQGWSPHSSPKGGWAFMSITLHVNLALTVL